MLEYQVKLNLKNYLGISSFEINFLVFGELIPREGEACTAFADRT